MAKVKYFSGDVELKNVFPAPLAGFRAIGGVPSKHNKYDSFYRLAGYSMDHPGSFVMPVTRKIFFKSNPSLHVCNSRCRSATGHNCECSCGGKFHGIDS